MAEQNIALMLKDDYEGSVELIKIFNMLNGVIEVIVDINTRRVVVSMMKKTKCRSNKGRLKIRL